MKLLRLDTGTFQLETAQLFVNFNHYEVNEVCSLIDLFKGNEYVGCIRGAGFSELMACFNSLRQPSLA